VEQILDTNKAYMKRSHATYHDALVFVFWHQPIYQLWRLQALKLRISKMTSYS